MKYLKLYETFNKIIVYHRSNDREHMENANFSIDMCNDIALFGKSIYFSACPDISQQLGKYLCKFEIILQEPVLNMNKKISCENELIDLFIKFNKMFDLNIEYNEVDFDDLSGKFNVQYGEFFDHITENFNWDYNIYYRNFIQSLGYNSFKYFQNYHTDFITKLGDYGISYGIYNPNDIKFIDGPF